MMKIIVMFPTSTEAQFFSHPHASIAIGGVGLSATAYNTGKLIAQHQPDWLIMAGIAGVYSHSRFKVKDVVLVQSECESDLGFFTSSGFKHLADLDLDMDFSVTREWTCPYLSPHELHSQHLDCWHSSFESILPVAKSNSMNAAMAPFIETANADIENMEGAAFFQVCIAEGQKFLEVRSISNEVKIGDEEWDMEGSIRSLTSGLYKLIDLLAPAS